MITLQGELTVRTFSGRFGLFNTGKLTTQIGEFIVKDGALDQLQEGKYPGQFVVKLIKPSSYVYNGRVVVETRAYLEHMMLDETTRLSDEELADFGVAEQDPVIEESIPAPISVSTDAYPVADAQNDDPALFGRLWPLGQTVRLESTCDRIMLRRQIHRLGQLGYQLEPTTQVWSKKTSD